MGDYDHIGKVLEDLLEAAVSPVARWFALLAIICPVAIITAIVFAVLYFTS